MCIIAIKEKNYDIPKNYKSILKTCFKNNPDGAGYSILRKNSKKVYFKKGFMFFQTFYDSLMSKNIGKDDTVICHFRISTKGGVSGEMCHPFPVTKNDSKLMSMENEVYHLMFHNGTIPEMGNAKLSDTAMFAKEYLSNIKEYTKTILDLIQYRIKSRMAIIRKGEVLLIGDFNRDKDNGMIFSNQSYKKKKYKYTRVYKDYSYYTSYGTKNDYFDYNVGNGYAKKNKIKKSIW